jgi:tryptophan synthase beta chain
VAEAIQRAPRLRPDQILLVNLSGRGDKDLDTVMQELKERKELRELRVPFVP